MVKIIITLMLIIIIFLASCAYVKYSRRKTHKEINNFVCYYGEPDISGVSMYDFVILEQENYTRDQIGRITTLALVVGYCSIGELDKHNYKYLKDKSGWFLDSNNDGKPDVNENWDSYYANPASPAWQEFIISKVRHIISDMGCNGIFLDTIDTGSLRRRSSK